MHSPKFPGTFPSTFLTFILVGSLQNIHFNIKDSDYFDKYVLLVSFTDTLVCITGIFGTLGAPEAVAFLTSQYVFSYYSEHFLVKF